MANSFGKRGAAVAAPSPARLAAPEPIEVAAADRPISRIPVSTLLILVLLTGVYAWEVHVAGYTVSPRALVALGGIDGNHLFRDHEWWRLFTAPLLHLNAEHIIGNGVCLLITGILLEPLVGRGWFAGLFALGGVAGGLASALYNPPDIVSAGASGAIMAQLMAAFVVSFNDEVPAKVQRALRRRFTIIALPSLLPALTVSVDHVDYSAHAGGALAGAMAAMILRIFWTDGAPQPEHQGAGLGLTGVALALSCFALLQTSQPAMLPGLIPESAMPDGNEAAVAQSGELVARYGRDPRAHYFRAIYYLKREDLPDAEDQLRTALDGARKMADAMPEQFELSVRLTLAIVLTAKGQQSEAARVMRPACDFAKANARDEKGLTYLQGQGICL
ncbi:MAG TPA: rhomboid family intramembrane serine protease [Rhizomicrobium sp.]|jgi:membrane associated rhomboid family serine protease